MNEGLILRTKERAVKALQAVETALGWGALAGGGGGCAGQVLQS